MEPQYVGRAPCTNCGTPSEAPIDINSAKPDGKGGTWYRVTEDVSCTSCSKPLGPFHVPGNPKKEETQRGILVPDWPVRKTVP